MSNISAAKSNIALAAGTIRQWAINNPLGAASGISLSHYLRMLRRSAASPRGAIMAKRGEEKIRKLAPARRNAESSEAC